MCQDTSPSTYSPPPLSQLAFGPTIRQYIRRLSGRRRSPRPVNMLLLLARHVDLELSFGSSSNQPSPYCSEKRSLHLQLEKRTVLYSLDRSASCERWRFQGSTAHTATAASTRGRRRGFLSDRKYRYHPHTQAEMSPIAGHGVGQRQIITGPPAERLLRGRAARHNRNRYSRNNKRAHLGRAPSGGK